MHRAEWGAVLDTTTSPSPRPASVAGRAVGVRRGSRRARLAWLLVLGTVLAGLAVAGGPVGLCLVGPRGSDLELVALAGALAG